MSRKTIYILIVLAFIIGLFFSSFTFHVINNRKMEATLRNGERIIIDKLKCGFELPFLNISVYRKVRVSVNDIIAFRNPRIIDLPLKDKSIMISRCVALPGDTFQIMEKDQYVNNRKILNPDSTQFRYRIVLLNNIDWKSFFDKYNISNVLHIHSEGIYDVAITNTLARKLEEDSLISDIRLLNTKRDRNSPLIFPADIYYSFTENNFGPVLIPYKDWTVPINMRNIGLYKRIIEYYENNSLEITDDIVYINSEIADSYTFKKNYYFVVDDNRDFAEDSRHWGFLPDDHIIGDIVKL